jgi:cobaltochelatase CobN
MEPLPESGRRLLFSSTRKFKEMGTDTIKKIAAAAFIALAALIFYLNYISVTEVALVNFPDFQAASIAKSTDDKFVRVRNYKEDQISKATKADFIIVFAMGLKIDSVQRAQLQKYADKGKPIYSIAVTNPANDINSLDSLHIKKLSEYLSNRHKTNYKNVLRYIRRDIAGKRFFAPEAGEIVVTPSDVFYHLDESKSFGGIAEYEEYYKTIGKYKDGAPRIAIVGSIGDPYAGNRAHIDSIIIAFERKGNNVFPILSTRKRLEMLQAAVPDAVIYMPHGRLAMGRPDESINWLKSRNIPLFAPTTILSTEEKWLADEMGMSGGFLSQSVVVPELDGGILPYTLIAQHIDNDGLHLFKAIPDRLESFSQIVCNFIELKNKPNSEKKLAIYYFKGAGASAMVASGLEVAPSLLNFLRELEKAGYYLGKLPADEKEIEALLQQYGSYFGEYAQAAASSFARSDKPALIEAGDLEKWMEKSMPAKMIEQVREAHGRAPGKHMAARLDGAEYLALPRLQLGNVVLIPQPAASGAEDDFMMVHGTGQAPPYLYIAAYLWAKHSFNADAMMHFGTHGSLEFTPKKQVSLSSYDWPDRLVGTTPHFYLYTISNVGEGIIAKRRSYATLVSHITPPFMESSLRGEFADLNEKIKIYHNREDAKLKQEAAKDIFRASKKLGILRDLVIDSVNADKFGADEIDRIENFADELANEKITGQLYVLGKSYDKDKVLSSIVAICASPIAYAAAAIDRESGKVTAQQLENQVFFNNTYILPANKFVKDNFARDNPFTAAEVSALAKLPINTVLEAISLSKKKEYASAHQQRPSMPNRQHNAQASSRPDASTGATATVADSIEPTALHVSISEYMQALNNISIRRKQLEGSPAGEIQSIINALSGGYVAPSPGGDPVANPNTLPTGRNLFSINAEATPSKSAWDKGVLLVKSTLEHYMKRNGSLPRKVSYTFWSSEFIETEGATVAQALYMLGVEPIWDAFGRVSELRLIPSHELGRPRIDIAVQTSGQLRDIAASRLVLINRAVEMAAAAQDPEGQNFVSASAAEIEKLMIEKGVSPVMARQMSKYRVFGGLNGSYGTGIMGMVESGSRWETEDEIAKVYLNNMSAIYGNTDNWGNFRQGLLEAVLHDADLVVQPRQNNTWGPISLDHVYEFMGGMNLAIRHVTGKDPDAYFSDYRNRHRPRMQEAKEAIAVEARATIFNPAFLAEQLKGSASSAAGLAQTVNNVYGWTVMKPDAIDNEFWDKIHSVFVQDEYNMQMAEFFRNSSPAAIQEITAIMLETARKGYWKATPEQLKQASEAHASSIENQGASCSGFTCDNHKLKDFIASNISPQAAAQYKTSIDKIRTEQDASQGTVLSKENVSGSQAASAPSKNSKIIGLAAALLIILISYIVLKRKKKK